MGRGPRGPITDLAQVFPQKHKVPDLRKWDIIAVSSSAGKDSQAMLSYVVYLATKSRVLDRVVVIHANLGPRVDWAEQTELARTQARMYGLRFIEVKRPQGDLLEQVEHRARQKAEQKKKGSPWPGFGTRFCTADHKDAQIVKALTQLVREAHKAGMAYPVRILDCVGLRAEENKKRADKANFAKRDRWSNSRRTVWTWLPIQGWTTAEVWKVIGASGIPHHPCYDRGMSRLSCVLCPLAGQDHLTRSAYLNPKQFEEWSKVEEKVIKVTAWGKKGGWRLKEEGFGTRDIRERLAKGDVPKRVGFGGLKARNPCMGEPPALAFVHAYFDDQMALALEWGDVESAERLRRLQDAVNTEAEARKVMPAIPARFKAGAACW
jgi:3'-phosphoadenosine 5'-phosphosulfate sulfotransferase (PAPS reductase)/FAD synthetase